MVDPVIKSSFSIFSFIVGLERAKFALFQPTKSEDNVRAEIWLDVFRCELSDLGTVLRPISVIADDLEKTHIFKIVLNFSKKSQFFKQQLLEFDEQNEN